MAPVIDPHTLASTHMTPQLHENTNCAICGEPGSHATHHHYRRPIHTGSSNEIVAKLLAEAEDISTDGFMRLHAKCRELDRIAEELRELGVDFLCGTEEHEGEFTAVRDHADGCSRGVGSDCRCPPFWTAESCV